MSVLIVGVSHRTAPVPVLELLALGAADADKLLADVLDTEPVSEVVVLHTCNRIEIYCEVDRFHQSVEDVSGLLAERTGVSRADLANHLYVHYDQAAVAHAFAVTAGLDSMVVGESQVLGQVREALRSAQAAGGVGSSLNVLFQQALRVGKRAHAETDIDRVGPSLVSAALDQVGPAARVAGRRALVVGAGSMASLAATTLRRRGVADLTIVSRQAERASRLAAVVGGRGASFSELPAALADADIVVSCTGAGSVVIPVSWVAAAVGRRESDPLVILDLALPHDVAPEVASLPGVVLIGLAELSTTLTQQVTGSDIAAARRIVAEEVGAFDAARRAARVAPTVVALRLMATGVVEAELARLTGRLPDLDAATRAEVEQTVRRVAHKLLHAPTVRMKELADKTTAESSYADALAELFALDPTAVAAVTDVAGTTAEDKDLA